jgi:hypothetical protein
MFWAYTVPVPEASTDLGVIALEWYCPIWTSDRRSAGTRERPGEDVVVVDESWWTAVGVEVEANGARRVVPLASATLPRRLATAMQSGMRRRPPARGDRGDE